MSERPTPETDALRKSIDSGANAEAEMTSFARKLERERDEAREKAERYRIEANAMMMQRDEAVESIMIILEENRHLADGDDCTLAKLKSVVPEWK